MLSIAVVNTMTRSNLERKAFVWLTCPDTEGDQGRDRGEPWRELLAVALGLTFSFRPHAFWDLLPRDGTTTLGWTFQHQSTSEKMPPHRHKGQSNGGNFSVGRYI